MAAGGNLLHGWSALTWATASLGALGLQGQGAVLASWAPPQLAGPASWGWHCRLWVTLEERPCRSEPSERLRHGTQPRPTWRTPTPSISRLGGVLIGLTLSYCDSVVKVSSKQ